MDGAAAGAGAGEANQSSDDDDAPAAAEVCCCRLLESPSRCREVLDEDAPAPALEL